MSTTYSNPKEMLGYIVVKFIDQQLPLLQNIPYDRRAVFAFYYQLKGLDAQLISFREDMNLTLLPDDPKEQDIVINYRAAMIEINEIIKENWRNVHAKDYEDFVGALYRWAELIASCYPKLGLVPESDTMIDDKRENLIEPDKESMEEEKDAEIPEPFVEPIESRSKQVSKQEFETIVAREKPGSHGSDGGEIILEQSAADVEREQQKQLRRQAYRLI